MRCSILPEEPEIGRVPVAAVCGFRIKIPSLPGPGRTNVDIIHTYILYVTYDSSSQIATASEIQSHSFRFGCLNAVTFGITD
jgi:hypothetical protein